jgi:hypothetical protein
MAEICELNRCENPAVSSIEDDQGSFSFCDAHFDGVCHAALHDKLSLADAVDAVTLAEAIESGREGESPITATGENPAMRLPVRTARVPQHDRLEYRLDCGRDVLVEEIRITRPRRSVISPEVKTPFATKSSIGSRTEPLSNFRESAESSSSPSRMENCRPTRSWSRWSPSPCPIPPPTSQVLSLAGYPTTSKRVCRR